MDPGKKGPLSTKAPFSGNCNTGELLKTKTEQFRVLSEDEWDHAVFSDDYGNISKLTLLMCDKRSSIC